MEELTLSLQPFVPGPGKGAVLRVVTVAGGFEVGCAVRGHGDLRGGIVSAAELSDFAARLLKAANARAIAEFNDFQAHVRPSGNGE